MKKIAILTLAISALAGSAAFASTVPVTDVMAGQSNVQFDYGVSGLSQGHKANGHSAVDVTSRKSYSAGISSALNSDYVLSYDYNYNKSKAKGEASDENSVALSTKNSRVLVTRKLTDKVNVYAGATYTTFSLPGGSEDRFGYQVGVTGYMPLADKLQGFASFGLGNSVKESAALGATYSLTPEVGLSAYYSYDRYSAKEGNQEYQATANGFNVGLGYHF